MELSSAIPPALGYKTEAKSNNREKTPKKPGKRGKYTTERIKNMLISFENHFQEKNDVKYAWNCVADEHGIKSGKAAEMAVRRHQKENK